MMTNANLKDGQFIVSLHLLANYRHTPLAMRYLGDNRRAGHATPLIFTLLGTDFTTPATSHKLGCC